MKNGGFENLVAKIPKLDQLHLRHMGLTESLCVAYSEAASVCLSRHYSSPQAFVLVTNDRNTERPVYWEKPSERLLRAWNNESDATRDGAYSLSLAAVEIELGLVAVGRAETFTGADYYVNKADESDDLESAYRLEVSGTDLGSEAEIRGRLRQKVEQTKRGKSNLPALASVVGFKCKMISIESVEI